MLVHKARQSSLILLGGYHTQCQMPNSDVAAKAPQSWFSGFRTVAFQEFAGFCNVVRRLVCKLKYKYQLDSAYPNWEKNTAM